MILCDVLFPFLLKRVTFEEDLQLPQEPGIKDEREYVEEFIDNNNTVDTYHHGFQVYSNQYAYGDQRRQDFA